jgi:hypothetical protein
MTKPKETINLGFCPCCKDEFDEGSMKRTAFGVVWCYLCSFNMEEQPSWRRQNVVWAKDYKKNMMQTEYKE